MDKDKFLNTPDEHFNTNAQYWYFSFQGTNKPKTNKPFEVFIQALFDVYFFIKQNPNKPFGCIEKIKKISDLNDFNETEKIILIDKILGVLYHYPHPDKLQKVYIQITDFRNDLSPYLEDPEIKDFKFRFDIDIIKAEISNIKAPGERYRFIMNLIFDFQASVNEMDELELMYYQNISFLEYLKTEAERANFNNSMPPEPFTIIPNPPTLDQQQSTDKVINAIAKLMELDWYFIKSKPESIEDTIKEVETVYFTFPEVLERELNKFRKENPNTPTSLKTIAESEEEEIKAKINEIKEISTPNHYSKQPSMIRAKEYLLYLSDYKDDTEPTAETLQPETTEQKIKRILEPLRGAFDNPGHIDKIVKALAEYSDSGKLPSKTETKIIHLSNETFYPYFKKVKNETNLTNPGIASVLTYFICQNNGSGNSLAPKTIEKNIKKRYSKL